jgi:hypothetical protein
MSTEIVLVDDRYKIKDGSWKSWMVLVATIYTFGFYIGSEFNYGLIFAKFIAVYNATENNRFYAGKKLNKKPS